MMQTRRFVLVSALLLIAPACQRLATDLSGLRCDAGRCLDGYVCHPERDICVEPTVVSCTGEGVCPSTTSTGDACSSEGTFIPCADEISDCRQGCRTCETAHWSECSAAGCIEHSDCDPCQKCDTSGSCVDQEAGSDVKGECTDTVYCNGVETCDGDGSCQAGTDPCPSLPCDDASDSCTCSTNDDCPLCHQCNIGTGLCVAQAEGVDLKEECTTGLCRTGSCNGAGACGLLPVGDDCGVCRSCNGSGTCVTNSTDHGDCALCYKCSSGDCGVQTDSDDLKNECDSEACNTGDCDGAGACGVDPSCLPAHLELTADSPVALCGTSTLTIDLHGYTGATADLACSAPPVPIPAGGANNVADFEGDDQGWTPENVGRQDWQGLFPSSCPADGSGQFMRFDDGATGGLTKTFHVTGYRNIAMSLLAGYRDDVVSAPDNGEHISVTYCCGAGCTTFVEAFVVPNGAEAGGSNGCRVVAPTILPTGADACADLRIRCEYANSGPGDEWAAVDDVELTGELIFAPISESGGGFYQSSVSSCIPASASVTCTWDNGVEAPLSATEPVTFQ